LRIIQQNRNNHQLNSLLDKPLILYVLNYLRSKYFIKHFEKFTKKNIDYSNWHIINSEYFSQIRNLDYILENTKLSHKVSKTLNNY
jgi:hypothetical protein